MAKHNAEGTYDPESNVTYPRCDTCPACRSEGLSTDTTGCTLPGPHEWQRGRFTGVRTCARCGLLPLDREDTESRCPGPR